MRGQSEPPYSEVLRALDQAFRQVEVDFAIIGGVALGLLTRPRYTKDVDALVVLDIARVDEIAANLFMHGFAPLFHDAVDFARQSRVLALSHQPTGVRTDIIFGCLPLEVEVIARSVAHDLGDYSISLATAEDLVILKSIAHRDQDLTDIRKLAEYYPGLDRTRIKIWIEQYAELLETPELWSEIEPLLKAE
jgi:predicted nucleotidyltransferase